MQNMKTIGIAVLVLLGVVFASNFMRGFTGDATIGAPTPTAPAMTLPQLQAAAVTVAYDDLARNTEQHTGKYLNMAGQVVQVIEDGDGAALRVLVDGDASQAVYVKYPGYSKARVLTDDMVQMIAQVDGRVTYKTVLGSEVTVPALTALWLKVGK